MKLSFTLTYVLVTIVALATAETLRLTIVDNDRNGTLVGLCNAETARFGPTDDFFLISGVIVNAVPINGCQPLQPPPYIRNDSLIWIALLARDIGGGCFFDRKIINAQEAGFGAALVFNFENNTSTMQASSLGDKVEIPAAMVTQYCGKLLRQQFAYNPLRDSRYRVGFRELFSFDFNVYVIAFVAIICASFMLFSLMWAIRWFRDWRIRQRSRLSRSSLRKLKVKKFVKGTDPYECCAICLEDFATGDKLRILPCNHAYHVKCIDPWLLKSRSCCPVCKRRVFPRQPGEPEGDSDGEAAGQAATGAVAAAAAAAATAGADAAVSSSVNYNSSNGGAEGNGSGERTPLLSSSPSGSSVASRGGFGAIANAERPTAFDNPALKLQDELLSAIAVKAVPAAVTLNDSEQQQRRQQSRAGSRVSSLNSPASSSSVSVSSLATSLEVDEHPASAAPEILTEVRVHAVSTDESEDTEIRAPRV